jgi:REP element-mobilizing transposase RayT
VSAADPADGEKHYRTWGRNRSPRLKGFDYSQPCAVFITICTADRRPLLKDRLADALQEQLKHMAKHWEFRIWCWCIMPDHWHAIVGPPGEKRTVSDLVGAVKSLATRTARRMGFKLPLWQRGFYDRVLRADEKPEKIAAYPVANPMRKGLIKEGGSWPWAYFDTQAL